MINEPIINQINEFLKQHPYAEIKVISHEGKIIKLELLTKVKVAN